MTPTPLLAELVAPNLHVALIHYPLGMLVVGVAIELLSFLWPRSSVRTAGRWMILLGALSAIPAAFSGIYALRAVARVDLAVSGRTWADIRSPAVSPVLGDPAIWHALSTHTLYQSIATAVAVLASVTWLGAGDAARRSLRLPVLGLLVLSVAGMTAGAWFSGEAIYKHGTGVEHGWQANAADTHTDPPNRVEQAFPPVELHVIAAGTTVALAMAAVGLSFRKLTTIDGPVPMTDGAGDDPHGSATMARSFNPAMEVGVVPKVFAGRAWLIAFVVAATTSLGGWYVLARSASILTDAKGHYGEVPKMLWNQVKPERDTAGHYTVSRRFFHLSAGGAIIGLPLVLAALARFAPRRRVVLSVVTGLLVAAVAAQVWFGILLLYDGPEGTINKWNPPSAEAAPAAPTVAPPTTQSV